MTGRPHQGTPVARSSISLAARALALLVQLYRAASAFRSPACRFVPSCSEYAHQAVLTHGARRGLVLAAKRLSHCHPRGGFGYDPVPPAPSIGIEGTAP